MSRHSTFDDFVRDTRQQVDEALERWLPRAPYCPPLLTEALRYSVLGGGKRLRPLIVLGVADAVDRRTGRQQAALALPAACAIEYIHTYSLIHDDLPAMDNDALRRGRPTLHVVYNDAVAILAGDALQAEAFALLAQQPDSSDGEIAQRKLRTLGVVAAAAGACGMVGGQVIDIAAAGQAGSVRTTLDAESLPDMHARKTGALIQASAVAGALMAGASQDAVDAASRWAQEIGVAFQIVDDILDVEGSAADLGKTAGKDAAGAKPTYPALFGLERSRAEAAEHAARARTALRAGELEDGWLDHLTSWILERRS